MPTKNSSRKEETLAKKKRKRKRILLLLFDSLISDFLCVCKCRSCSWINTFHFVLILISCTNSWRKEENKLFFDIWFWLNFNLFCISKYRKCNRTDWPFFCQKNKKVITNFISFVFKKWGDCLYFYNE